MVDEESITKKRCLAMIEAGIEDPDSEEGAQFCAGDRHGLVESQCPYPVCVVFETLGVNRVAIARERRRVARQLHIHGVSVDDIALILDRKPVTIRHYFRR